MTKELIVAHYQEDISWTKKFWEQGWVIKVYDKGPKQDLGLGAYEYASLPNIGREPHTYIHYIIENYDNLPDWMLFSQGDPMFHYPEFADLAYLVDVDKFHWLSNYSFESDASGLPHHSGLPVAEFYEKITGKQMPPTIPFKPNCLFVLRREDVLKHDRAFYEKLLDMSMEPQAPWALERLWGVIFG